jgi:hypothetical protein
VSGSARSHGETEQFSVASVSRTAEYKEDNAVDNAVREGAAPSVWKETGVDPLELPGPFRKLCEDLWTRRSGTIFEFMRLVLDAWRALGSTKYPAAWAKRKAELGPTPFAKRESDLLELESIPWQK